MRTTNKFIKSSYRTDLELHRDQYRRHQSHRRHYPTSSIVDFGASDCRQRQEASKGFHFLLVSSPVTLIAVDSPTCRWCPSFWHFSAFPHCFYIFENWENYNWQKKMKSSRTFANASDILSLKRCKRQQREWQQWVQVRQERVTQEHSSHLKRLQKRERYKWKNLTHLIFTLW